MDSLWPDFTDTEKVKTPSAILKEQGKSLGLQFRNQILGEVKITRSGDIFECKFMIVAPSLSYSYNLFKIEYGLIDIYPVAVILDGDIAVEIASGDKDLAPFEDVVIRADDEANFRDVIRRIFSSTKAQSVIRALKQHLP